LISFPVPRGPWRNGSAPPPWSFFPPLMPAVVSCPDVLSILPYGRGFRKRCLLRDCSFFLFPLQQVPPLFCFPGGFPHDSVPPFVLFFSFLFFRLGAASAPYGRPDFLPVLIGRILQDRSLLFLFCGGHCRFIHS